MSPEETIAIEVARQIQKVMPSIKAEFAKAIDDSLKSLKADVLTLAQDIRDSRERLTIGSATLRSGPTREELHNLLPAKLAVTSLQEVCEAVAKEYGVDMNDNAQWSVWAGTAQPSSSQLARRSA